MTRFVQGIDRTQVTLFPESLDEYVSEDNPVCVVDLFVDKLDLLALGFTSAFNRWVSYIFFIFFKRELRPLFALQ